MRKNLGMMAAMFAIAGALSHNHSPQKVQLDDDEKEYRKQRILEERAKLKAQDQARSKKSKKNQKKKK